MSDEDEPAAEDRGGWLRAHPSGLASASSTRRRHRGRWTLFGGVLSGIALVTLLLAFGLRHDPSVVRSALIGRAAPDFDLQYLEGTGHLRLSDLRGQVVVVNFWGSWCLECRQEHNALAGVWQRYRDQGVVLVGISFQDSAASSKAFADELKMDWPLLSDQASRTALA